MTQSTDGEEVSDRNDRRATHTNMIKTNIISDSIDIPNLLNEIISDELTYSQDWDILKLL